MLLRNKLEIEDWLHKHYVQNYKLIEDEKYGYVVNINGNVNLIHKNLKSIDIKFNEIYGNFDCSENELTSLRGCPEIVDGNFWCSYNKLESLEECPVTVNGVFNCQNNKLTSLVGCPKIINGIFDCQNNKLTSLVGCPKIINGIFDCSNNFVKSLKDFPIYVKEIYLNNNDLSLDELIYLPKEIKENFIDLCGNEKILDLQKIHNFNELKKIVHIHQEKNKIINALEKDTDKSVKNPDLIKTVKI